MQIIIVSDESTEVAWLQDAIGQCGMVSTLGFTHPAAALDWCAAHEPDLVLVDYFMRSFDGLEFIRRFRALPGREDLPVVLMHRSAANLIRGEALRLGATDFLAQPIDLPELVARVVNLLALRQARLQLRERRWRHVEETVDGPLARALLH